VVGVHHKATPTGRRAVDGADAYSRVEPHAAPERIGLLRQTARIVRNASSSSTRGWSTKPVRRGSSGSDVCEAIDFCEYYATGMELLAQPQPVAQLPGERDEMIYIPARRRRGHPTLEFPLAILAG